MVGMSIKNLADAPNVRPTRLVRGVVGRIAGRGPHALPVRKSSCATIKRFCGASGGRQILLCQRAVFGPLRLRELRVSTGRRGCSGWCSARAARWWLRGLCAWRQEQPLCFQWCFVGENQCCVLLGGGNVILKDIAVEIGISASYFRDVMKCRRGLLVEKLWRRWAAYIVRLFNINFVIATSFASVLE
jgi:hypothetical protein